jgi:hypothetical protein
MSLNKAFEHYLIIYEMIKIYIPPVIEIRIILTNRILKWYNYENIEVCGLNL